MTQQEIDDLCSFRDAAARNCAVAVLEHDMVMATKFAERFDSYQRQLSDLYKQRAVGRGA